MKNSIIFPVLAVVVSLAFALPHSVAAQSVYWNFGTTNGVATPTSGVPAGVSVSAVSQGNNNGTTTLFSTTSASSGYTGASGQFNVGAAARVGALNTATNAYFEFTVTPQSNYEFTLTGISFGSRETSTGPKAYSLRSSADNYATDLATGTLLANSTWALKSNSGLNQTSQLPITFRLFGHSGTGSPSAGTANWRVDDLTVTINSQAIGGGSPAITSASTASGVAFDSFNYQITASNSPNSFGAENLPAGLSVDTSTGLISGTPTVVGVFNVTITATNASGTGSGILTLTVTKNPGAPTISSSLTSTGLVGSAYSYQIVADNSPTSYGAATLPAGLTVDSGTGLISGTPTSGGTFNVSISASNALGSDTKTLVLTINSPPVITSPTSGSLYVTNNFAYTISASFSPTSYGASNLPSGWTVTSSNGVITNGVTALTTGTTSFGISASNSFGESSATYTLKVLDQTMQDAVPLNVVVNKFVNGTPDQVQLLVIGTGVPGSTVDMRGMIIKDFSSSMANDGGGKFIFSDNAIWSAVPAGTFVTLSAGTTQAEDIDPLDFYLAVNLGNTAYFANGGGDFNIATTDMLLLKSAGSGVSGVAGGIHALAGGTAGAQFTAYTGAKLRTTGTSGTDFGVIALNSTSQLSDYGASGQPEATDAQGGQAAASLNFSSWNSPGNESYVKLLRGITDGTGTASIVNGDGSSDFFGQNIFGRNLPNQTVSVSYLPASTQTAITALSITVPSEMGTPSVPNISVSGAGAGSASVAVTNQVVTISGLNALNPDPVDISISGLTTPDTALSVTNSGRYTFNMQSQGSGGSLAPLGSSPTAVVIIPIANARNADPTTFVPTLLGQTVAVEGVANVGKLGGGTSVQISSSIQDSTHGIGTYSTNVANLPTRGNRYVVSGAVQQSSGYVRINITNAGAIYDFGAIGDPAPVTVTVPEFNASTGATNGINLQSRVIRLENLSYVSGTWSNNSTVTLRDVASNNVAVRIQANSTAVSPPSYPVTLTGIAGQFDTASPFDSGFQIQPRDQSDAPVLPPVISSATNATATNGIAFSYQITTDNNPPAVSYAAAPLPGGLTIDTATGLISGTPSATGTFNVTISAANAGGTGTAGLVLTVQAGGGGAYDTWASGFGLNPATNGAPTADPDADMFNNAQEYAFGTDPTQGTPSLLGATASGGNLVVTWLQRSDVTYAVQSTANLATTAFANDGSVTVVDGPVSPTPPAGYTRKQISVPATGNKFYRVTGTTP